MKDQELRDLFHSFRPELGDEEAFMARLNEQIDSRPSKSPLKGDFIFSPFKGGVRGGLWAAGIAAAIAVALFIIKPIENNETREAASYASNQYHQAMLSMTSISFPTFEETVAEIEQSGEQLQMAIAEMKK